MTTNDEDPATRANPGAGTRRRRAPSARRRVLLIVASLLFSATLLGLLEGSLRLAGYGGYPPTFVRAGTLANGSTLVLTSHGGPTSYFFANRSLPGSLDPSAFEMPKPAGTLRIMIVGESAAKGNPYPRPLSAGAFLAAMLSDLLPGRRIEVVNLGVTAIASFPALGILTEALAYDPDLVVIYLGNNEFYGAFGVASLHSAGRSPWMIRLIRATRSLAIAQFIDRHLRGDQPHEQKTLMEAMVGQSFIAPGDPARAAAARNLETFVSAMLDRCRAAGVPAIVCTPPANERDLAPLGASDLSSLAPESRVLFDQLLDAAQKSMESDPSAAEASIRQAIALAPEHARARYLLGQALLAQGREEESAVAFRAALDLDPMPWRPPSSSVEAIRRAAASRGAPLCDLQAAFRAESPGGSTGWELMDDHVHPSLRGQALIARSIVRTLAGLAPPSSPAALRIEDVESLPDWTAYATRLGANPYDEYAAAHAMRLLASAPFFRQTNPMFLERNDAYCRQVEASSPPEVQQQIRVWLDPRTHQGGLRPIGALVGRALAGRGDFASAEPLFRVAAGSVEPYGSWDLEYTFLSLYCRLRMHGTLGDADRQEALEAIQRGRFLIDNGLSTTGAAERFVGEFHVMRDEFAEAVPFLLVAQRKLEGMNRAATDEALVRAYVGTGQRALAQGVIDEGFATNARFAGAYRNMAALLEPGAPPSEPTRP
ncbi:MAG: tetratricopeptide repeat protein [Phycisphaerales bacterium]|nr:tetratricopeptide repeat protein [Phycisphaerales bacterium]